MEAIPSAPPPVQPISGKLKGKGEVIKPEAVVEYDKNWKQKPNIVINKHLREYKKARNNINKIYENHFEINEIEDYLAANRIHCFKYNNSLD